MTTYAIGQPDWRVIPVGESIAVNGVQASYAAMLALPEDMRQGLGILPVLPDPIPAGKRIADPVPQDGPDGPVWLLEDVPPPEPEPAPDGPTLGDFRIGLGLWKMPDGTTRLDDVAGRIAKLKATGNPLAIVAEERFSRALTVSRAELLQLGPVFGFTPEDIEESLWRAHQVHLGDYSGQWPLPEELAA